MDPNEIYMPVLPQMSETYILELFRKFNEKPIGVHFKRGRNNSLEGAIIRFPNNEYARKVITKLNGKFSSDPEYPYFRFSLSRGTKSVSPMYRLFIEGLSPDVDDYMLYTFFSSKYNSIFNARVVQTLSQLNHGYIKFSDEKQQEHCLNYMNGTSGLGQKRITITKPNIESEKYSNDPNMTTSQGNSDSGSISEKVLWGRYLTWNEMTNPESDEPRYPIKSSPRVSLVLPNDPSKLVDYTTEENCSQINSRVIRDDFYTWDAFESSQWLPIPLLNSSICLKCETNLKSETK